MAIAEWSSEFVKTESYVLKARYPVRSKWFTLHTYAGMTIPTPLVCEAFRQAYVSICPNVFTREYASSLIPVPVTKFNGSEEDIGLPAIYTTIGELSSKFEEFLAVHPQFDSDHDHMWQACADRCGNGAYLNKLTP